MIENADDGRFLYEGDVHRPDQVIGQGSWLALLHLVSKPGNERAVGLEEFRHPRMTDGHAVGEFVLTVELRFDMAARGAAKVYRHRHDFFPNPIGFAGRKRGRSDLFLADQNLITPTPFPLSTVAPDQVVQRCAATPPQSARETSRHPTGNHA